MTGEEAHRILSKGLVNAPSEHEWCMAFEMAIQALEQELIFDKIRDEIDLETRIQVKHYTTTDAVIDVVLDVIDKYKTESEE